MATIKVNMRPNHKPSQACNTYDFVKEKQVSLPTDYTIT
jgi:hypothetical protein